MSVSVYKNKGCKSRNIKGDFFMRNKNRNTKGAVLGMLTAAAIMSAAPLSAFAATPSSFNNSTASSVTNNTFSAGSDVSQGKTGSMADMTLGGESASSPTENKSQTVSVYATKASYVQIKVPQVLVGDATKSKYLVGVKGDITTKQSVTVAPSASTFKLTDVYDSARSVTANVAQTKTNWSCNDLLTGGNDYVYTTGDITYNKLHAGSYAGTFNLAVTLNYAN